ncbi:MAG: hypothetical protein GXP62_06370 [Oligoflexia bacterium]|nr:hypothetical protein [Oligoflexia bacterium]
MFVSRADQAAAQTDECLLPAPDRAAEDACVAAWADSDDVDGLVALVTACIAAHRPQLAARLVGLLDDRVEIPSGSPLARAQAAARMLLLAPGDAVVALSEDLAEAWICVRRGRMKRLKARIRERAQGGSGVFLDQRSPTRRKPRLTGRFRRG